MRRVSLRLLNLDCRYPRDLLQPARKKKVGAVMARTAWEKKKMTARHASLAPLTTDTFRKERRRVQAKHLWDMVNLDCVDQEALCI